MARKQRTSVKIHLSTPFWPGVSLLLLIVAILWPHRAWSTLAIILGCTWVLSYLWVRSLSRGLAVERKMRYGWVQVGDRLEERFTVSNRSSLPALWLELQDHSNLPNYTAGRITQADGGEVLEWQTLGFCSRRGLFTLGPTSLHSGDPFGLWRVDLELPNRSALLILPPILSLPGIAVAAGGSTGEGQRPRRSALETTVSASTVRDYVPGEPLKAIHWRTSARRETLFVRQFEHTPASDWWIFLDLEARHHIGNGFDSTEEHAVILAASLAARGLREGKNVGLVTAGQDLVLLPPQRGSAHLMEILRRLALIHTGQVPLGDLLRGNRCRLQHGASVILITPNVQGGWMADLLQMSSGEITPTVLLLDPATYQGKGSTAGVQNLLARNGIAHHVIARDLLDKPEARPGQRGRWEWRLVGPGKAVVVRRPTEDAWRQVG